MIAWFRMRKSAGKISDRLVGGVIFCALAVGMPRVLPAAAVSDCMAATASRSAPAVARSHRADWASVLDVAIQPDGVLRGEIVAPDGGPATRSRVAMRSRDGMAAETTSDAQGRFALCNLSPGLYELEAQTPQGVTRQHYRVWTSQAAPPHAVSGVRIQLGEATIRGQIPFAMTSFSQAATVSAILAGAIAAPVIYENAKGDNRVPSSP